MKKFALWIFSVGLIGVVAAIASGTGDEGRRMPDLGGAVAWLNSTPLSATFYLGVGATSAIRRRATNESRRLSG
jgi:hypothetical protein